MFVCGPTVYDYSHVGHGKTYTQFDLLARSLRYFGIDVSYLVNITDIDDKIIIRAREKGVEPQDLAREYEAYYIEDMRSIGNASVSKYARATDYIEAIISQVERLVEKGYAYRISDGFYFDISKFVDYGQLSGRQEVRPEDALSRIDENPEKKNPGDFCLWKFSKPGEPKWQSVLGEGRPGWHIEDTAITETEFGQQYDIHGGAADLIFPHHEAEIAQMEAISGKKPFVRLWMHVGFLNIKGEKMSKSLSNFITIREVLERGVPPLALRYFYLSSHYRTPTSFSWEALEAAENAYRKLKQAFSSIHIPKNAKDNPLHGKGLSFAYQKEFVAAIEDDLNMPEALAVVWRLVKDESLSPVDKRAMMLDFDQVLGLDLERNEYEVKDVPKEIERLLVERESARLAQNWTKADQLREAIRARGFDVSDSPSGQELKRL